MSKGVICRLDKLGRIFIPKEYRHALGIKVRDPMEMVFAGDYIKVIPAAKKDRI